MQSISASSISGSSSPAQIAARQEQILASLTAQSETSTSGIESSAAVGQPKKGDGPPPPPPGNGPPPPPPGNGPPPGGASSSVGDADMESVVMSLLEGTGDTEIDTSASTQIFDAIAQYAQSQSAIEAA